MALREIEPLPVAYSDAALHSARRAPSNPRVATAMVEEQGSREKRRGKPSANAERLCLSLEPSVMQAIDAWSEDRTGTRPSRSEAARMLLVEQLRTAGYLKQ